MSTSTTIDDGQPVVAVDHEQTIVVWQKVGPPSSVVGQRYNRVPVNGDVNGDGLLDVSDVVQLINFLFAGGPAPR